MKTKTQPEAERDGLFEGPDPVTWIRIFGTAHAYELPRDRKVITVGSSPECDIVIQAPYISRLHCKLERLYDCLRVEDCSKNGTWVDDRRVKEPKDVRPGGTFAASGGITFLALNREMHAAYPTLSDILDWEDQDALIPIDRGWPTPSKVIVWGSGNDHLLITGPKGCDQDRLVRAIHSISPMRWREMVWVDSIPVDRASQKELLVRASKTTLVLKIDDKTPVMDQAFRSMLFSASYRIRVLVCAPSFDPVLKVLGPDHSYMRRIELRPLAFRTDQLGRLFDRQLEERGAPLRFELLTEANREALKKCEWDRNLDDLRLTAERLAAIERTGSLRKAAPALGIKNFSTLQKWFTNTMGLTTPLTVER